MAQRPRRAQPLADGTASPTLRALFLIPLLVALAAACTPTPPASAETASGTATIPAATSEPSAGSVAPASPTPPPQTPAASASTAACRPDSVKVSHDLVEGAAGTRYTTAVLTSNLACSISAFPGLGLRDANGAALVGAAAAQPGVIDLQPGAVYESAISFANWCGGEPSFPLTLQLLLGASEVPITGDSFPDEGEMPACVASTGPKLTGTAWMKAP